MKINPYLYFNGEATDAIALYERAFGVKAIVAKFKEVGQYDPSFVIQKGTEDWVMHANLDLGDNAIMVCDTPEPNRTGERVQLMVSLPSEDAVKTVFAVLKDGGTVISEPKKEFWADCFAAVKDKFSVNWLLSFETETQSAQRYGE
jgi:PhnB protein